MQVDCHGGEAGVGPGVVISCGRWFIGAKLIPGPVCEAGKLYLPFLLVCVRIGALECDSPTIPHKSGKASEHFSYRQHSCQEYLPHCRPAAIVNPIKRRKNRPACLQGLP